VGRDERIGSEEFRRLMQRVADGWNQGDARAAADCFALNARYSEPPDRQFYQGREQLFRFFGGGQNTPPAMRMTWHHLLFDEENQLGAGEYTFESTRRYHGVVIVKVVDGQISHWREYQYESASAWDEFAVRSRF